MSEDREDLLQRVSLALSKVRNARTGADVVSGSQVQGLDLEADGTVRFQFVLRPDDEGTLVREARRAAEAVEGVVRVKVDVKLPQSARSERPRPPRGAARAGTVPAPTPQGRLREGLKRIVAVSSGKGGVGKSTVAANVAVALAAEGHAVGLLDADIYGPDIPLMFGESGRPRVTGERGAEKIVPLVAHGVKLMSLGFLLDPDQPAIMRGPLIAGILKQFLEQVEWGELDYLVVDMPPGTGDAQLSLVQTIEIDGAVMVTTPQAVSTSDVRRAVRMFERTNTRVLGVVENMSGLECPHCHGHIDVFGAHGGRALAEELEIPFLGEVPLDPAVRVSGDAGAPTVVAAADSAAGRAFAAAAREVARLVESPVGAGAG